MANIEIKTEEFNTTIRVENQITSVARRSVSHYFNVTDTTISYFTKRSTDGNWLTIDYKIDTVTANGTPVNNAAEMAVLIRGESVQYFDSLITGNWVGYSLRRLTEAATNCIRVRRASDNAEMDIGFVDKMANSSVDVAALETFCAGTDGFVHTWYDQGGTVNNAVQATTTQQPQIVSGGAVILENGKPSIRSYTKYMNLQANFSTNSLFSVSRQTTYANLNYLLEITESGGFHASGRFEQFVNGMGFTTAGTDYSLSDTRTEDFVLRVHQWNRLFRNGQELSYLVQNPYNGTITALRILGRTDSNSTQGFASELIITADEQTNREDIEAYINIYYAIY